MSSAKTSLGHIILITLSAAIGGFLFGFDSGVISGCEKAIQSEFGLSACRFTCPNRSRRRSILCRTAC